MAGYCTLVLYFHSPMTRENTAAHSCNIQPYYLLTHQYIYIYIRCTRCTYSKYASHKPFQHASVISITVEQTVHISVSRRVSLELRKIAVFIKSL